MGMNLTALRAYMREQRIDAWLLADFRGSNAVLPLVLPPKRQTTRRVMLLLPLEGEPRVLTHSIDMHLFERAALADDAAVAVRDVYLAWPELHAWLARHVSGRRVAMEYSPGNALPVVSIADAGTVELVRALGAEVVSSADLIQTSIAAWSDAARRNHAVAAERTTEAMADAFGLIRHRLSSGLAVTEIEVQSRIVERFAHHGLEMPAGDGPIVAVNEHSGNPHFELTPKNSRPIVRGDWVLIDMWARVPGDANIYSDITQTGCCGSPTARQRQVFDTVRRARDAALSAARTAHAAGRAVQGWQLDQAARDTIAGAGLTEFIRHRTGHSLSPGAKVHGMGMNLDNLETHDTRTLLPRIGFTIEPGLYLPEFGVRNEINAWLDPIKGVEVTSCVQDEVVMLA